MKRSARITVAVLAPIGVVLVLLAVLPFLFRDRIAQRVQQEVNDDVNARVAWRGVGLSFFRHFPNLSLTLDDLSAAGVGRFEGDTLAAVSHLRVVLDVTSVVGNVLGGTPLVVRAIELDQPRVHLLALEDGTANWNITKTPPAAPQPKPNAKPLAVSLRRFQITGGAIVFDDRHTRLLASLAGYDQTLSGDLSQSRVTIQTTATVDSATVVFAGIPYLEHVKIGLTGNVDADLSGKTYALANTQLRLNDLAVAASGSVKSAGSVLALDLAFKAPRSDFKSILSLVPGVYAHDFDKVQASGTIALDGWIKGPYGPTSFPAFALTTRVNDAAFKYADLPLPARSIAVDLSLSNPGGSADSTIVKLGRFHVVLGANPVDASMVLRTPVSDPDIDARLTGRVDLADLRRTVKLQGVDQLAGTVAANAAVRTRVSFLEKKQYDKVAANGTVDVTGLTVKGAALPRPLAVQQASLALAPERAQLKSFTGTVGTSDLQASGTLDNLIAFALHGDTLRGSASVTSKHFDLNEWRSGGDMDVIPVPPKIDVSLDATVGQLLYGKLTMTNARAKLRIANQRATLEQFQTNTLGGQIAVTGFYETTQPTKPTFDASVKLTKVDIPSAFQTFATVQMLAPVAKYASGTASTDVRVSGALGKNMTPVFPSLDGAGTLETSELALRDFPALSKLAGVTKLDVLNNPTFQALKAAFRIDNGRLTVQPFDVKLGGIAATIAGSNGLDQSLQYTMNLRVPRSVLGSGASQAIAGLASQAGKAGLDLGAAAEIPLAIQLGGTVTSPTVKVGVGNAASSAVAAAQQAVTQQASAAAAQVVAEAEQRAQVIKQSAQALADTVKQTGYRQADSLTAKAGDNPLLQLGAKAAADKLRKQSDDKAAAIVREANARADSLVASARAQAARVGAKP
ncbi:MAG TPA: AsmA-like C-terminal region-containing protein [Gemmatimonadaceae bacterium]